MSRPKITVITPTYNSEKDIEKCIKSVADQTYPGKEHLFIDNVSNDKTVEIIREYAARYPHIRLLSEKDRGIYDAMNKAIDLSEGEWLYFLGCDDLIYNDKVLEEIFTSHEANESDVIYGNVIWGNYGYLYDSEFSLLKLIEKNICHQAMFFRRDLFKVSGKYDIKYNVYADWVLNMKLFGMAGIRIKYIDKVIAIFNPEGYSSKNMDLNFARDKDMLIRNFFPKDFVDLYYSYFIEALSEKDKEIHKLKHELNSVYNTVAGQFIRFYKSLKKR
ncbi:MAG: glycosyltransferase [Chlorobiaceae bacterium]|nr:glycosyltransferase [Chlorobiaceae bacterium]